MIKNMMKSDNEVYINRSVLWLAVALLLAIFAFLVSASIPRTSPTLDEVAHVPKGYTKLVSGELRLARETPILMPAISAIPLLPYRLSMPLDSQAYKDLDQYAYGQQFLYENKISADRIIALGRYPIIILGVILGLIVFFMARMMFGDKVALTALALYVLEPNILANSGIATIDLGLSLFYTVAVLVFAYYLKSPTWRNIIFVGIATGLTMAVKHNGVLLFIVYLVVLSFMHIRKAKEERSMWRGIILPLVIIAAVAYLTIIVVYLGDFKPLVDPADPVGENLSALNSMLPMDGSSLSSMVYWFLEDVPVPAADWWRGFIFQLLHAGKGHPAFLLGQHSQTGWWYYFPIAMAVKVPIALLALMIAGAVLWKRLDVEPVYKWLVPVAILTIFLPAITGKIDIGIRYILPMFPFLIIMAASVFSVRLRGRYLVLAAALVWMAVSLSTIYPHYLTYFNEIGGGSRGGAGILVDSNLDWGQGLYDLRDWQKQRGYDDLVYSYFGAALPKEHGIKGREITNEEKYHPGPGTYAISATNLQAVFEEDKTAYQYFRDREPDEAIANSIYIYFVE